jgi:hypothetical protein
MSPARSSGEGFSAGRGNFPLEAALLAPACGAARRGAPDSGAIPWLRHQIPRWQPAPAGPNRTGPCQVTPGRESTRRDGWMKARHSQESGPSRARLSRAARPSVDRLAALTESSQGRLGAAQNHPAQPQEMPAPYAHVGFHTVPGHPCHPEHGILPLWCLRAGIKVGCPGGIRCGRELRRHRLAHEALRGSAPRNVQPPGLWSPRLWRWLCGFAGGRPFLLAGAARGARKSKPLWPWPPSRPPSRLRL